jgi:hypothetical protein
MQRFYFAALNPAITYEQLDEVLVEGIRNFVIHRLVGILISS